MRLVPTFRPSRDTINRRVRIYTYYRPAKRTPLKERIASAIITGHSDFIFQREYNFEYRPHSHYDKKQISFITEPYRSDRTKLKITDSFTNKAKIILKKDLADYIATTTAGYGYDNN